MFFILYIDIKLLHLVDYKKLDCVDKYFHCLFISTTKTKQKTWSRSLTPKHIKLKIILLNSIFIVTVLVKRTRSDSVIILTYILLNNLKTKIIVVVNIKFSYFFFYEFIQLS